MLRLNHAKIKAALRERGLRPSDLAREWGWSNQRMSYVLNKGGFSHVDRFSKLLRCKRIDLIAGLRR